MMYRLAFGIHLILFCFSAPVLATTVLIGGSGTDLGTFKILAERFQAQNPQFKIRVLPSMGSGGGVKALKHGKLHLAMLSRSLKPSESSKTITARHYANTPLVLAVSNRSSKSQITSKLVESFYLGEVKQWPDGEGVRPILRPEHDSDTRLLIKHIIKCKACFKEVYKLKNIPVALTDQESAELIQTIPGAIGTSTLSVILSEEKLIKPLELDGVMPSAKSISDNSYPMYKSLYYAYKDENSEKLIPFLNYINSDQGREILLETGHMIIQQ